MVFPPLLASVGGAGVYHVDAVPYILPRMLPAYTIPPQ
jgi:hypothetical protein